MSVSSESIDAIAGAERFRPDMVEKVCRLLGCLPS